MSDIILEITQWIGIIAFSVTGAMVGIEHGLDLFGVIFLGGITSFAGGVMRDVMLGDIPPRMFTLYGYLICSAVVSLLVFAVAYFYRNTYSKNRLLVDKIINIFDAIGLGAFTVVGSQIVIDAGYGDNWFMVIFLATATGIGGGILRDILVDHIPFVLRKHIYAMASIIGSLLYCILNYYKVNQTISAVAVSLTVILIRMMATVFKWSFPRANVEQK